MPTVFIIAPSPALRVGLRALLHEAGFEVVGEAAGPVLLAPADVILVTGEQVTAVGRALAGEEGAAMVALSADPRVAAQLRGLPLRGWALASPDSGSEELRAAVLAAAQGYVAVPHALAEALPGSRSADEPPLEALTARETEVLGLLSQGLPNKQIALRLQISEHTVKFHIAAIFAKLGAASRTEAVSIGARQGLITL
ncbi:MAG: response regulator transcription factor [Oscillochloridaceae bacterium umkhey_bin13]